MLDKQFLSFFILHTIIELTCALKLSFSCYFLCIRKILKSENLKKLQFNVLSHIDIINCFILTLMFIGKPLTMIRNSNLSTHGCLLLLLLLK